MSNDAWARFVVLLIRYLFASFLPAPKGPPMASRLKAALAVVSSDDQVVLSTTADEQAAVSRLATATAARTEAQTKAASDRSLVPPLIGEKGGRAVLAFNPDGSVDVAIFVAGLNGAPDSYHIDRIPSADDAPDPAPVPDPVPTPTPTPTPTPSPTPDPVPVPDLAPMPDGPPTPLTGNVFGSN